MEKISPKNRLLLVLGLGVGAAALSSCSLPNYSGEGNEFTLKGKIENVGEQSITVQVTEEIQANGWASEGWFDVGDSRQLHDNCDCHGAFKGRKQYGTVFDQSGAAVDISTLREGECVLIQGSVRTDSDGKYSHERAVYNSAQVIPC